MKLSRILPLMVGGAVAGMVVSSASPAQALSYYNFSFSNVNGGTAGTVSGTIELPDGDGTFAASSIIVNSAPAALGYTLPLNAFTTFTTTYVNSFTVIGGTIAPISSYGAQNSTEAFTLNFSNAGSLLSIKGSASATTGVQDANDATLTYSSTTPVPFDIPGGATIPTVGSLFALALMRQAKKRLAAKTLVVHPVETVV